MLLAAAAATYAQSFEVASIKPSAEATTRMAIHVSPGGRFTTTNTGLTDLLAFAYNVRTYQITGLTRALDDERFDIEAKPDTENSANPVRAMVQKLLADRFALTLHRETRPMPVYALVLAKGGPKFKPSDKDDMSISPGGKGRMLFQKVPMALFATQLSQTLGRTVLEKTGLTGAFDFALEFDPQQGPDSTGPSIFTALTEQLGLKLESTKAPVEVLVVDHAASPSRN